MQPGVMSARGRQEFRIPEGCWIVEVSNEPGDEAVSIARARVEPGVTTRWHELAGIDERYVVVQGRGIMHIQGVPPAEVVPGDVVLIPAGTAQRISNPHGEDLVFYCVCSPRFRQERYVPRPDLDEPGARGTEKSGDFEG
jgi:mannose-6-phosphate isomerase-like protein (cupin superfamily)